MTDAAQQELSCDVCRSRPAVVYCPADKAALCKSCDQDVHSANALSFRHHRLPLSPKQSLAAGPSQPLPDVPSASRSAQLAAVPSLASETSNQSESSGDSAENIFANQYQSTGAFSRQLVAARSWDSNRMCQMMSSDMSSLEDAMAFDSRACSGDMGMGFSSDMASYRGLVSSGLGMAGGINCWGSQVQQQAVKIEPGVWRPNESDRSLPQNPGANGSLRLDVNEVMNAWSDRDDVWSPRRMPQTCPEDRSTDDFLADEGLLPPADQRKVEEDGDGEHERDAVVIGVSDEGLTITREARVERYKKKRHNRQFNKKIRYEVRKLNAEKRPRIKGRFVKREQVPLVRPPPAMMMAPGMPPPMMGYYMY